MRRFYADSTAYRDHLAEKSERHYRNFLSLITRNVPAGSSVLEIGAGTGQVSRSLAREGYRVVSTDVSPLFLAVAGQPAEIVSARPPAVLASDVTALPFGNGTFDAVVAGELVEHLSDAAAALDEMARVVRPGGRIVLRSPALASPVWPLIDLPRLVRGRGGRAPHYDTLPQALRFFAANLSRCARIALRREPRFEQRSPDLDLAVEGGDRDAAYWSSPVEISRYLKARGFTVLQAVDATQRKGAFVAKWMPWLAPTIALVAEKRGE